MGIKNKFIGPGDDDIGAIFEKTCDGCGDKYELVANGGFATTLSFTLVCPCGFRVVLYEPAPRLPKCNFISCPCAGGPRGFMDHDIECEHRLTDEQWKKVASLKLVV